MTDVGSPDPLGAVIAALSLLPLWWFNAAHDFAGLRFQMIDRHPWAWQSGGWWQLAEQALVVGPVLAVLLALAVWRSWRAPVSAQSRAEAVLAQLATGLWLLFIVLGFLADNERFRWHWPLPAYLIALPLLAAQWPAFSVPLRRLALATSTAVIVLVLAYFAAGIQPSAAGGWFDGKRFPSNFSGWREVAQWQRELADHRDAPVAVDNFMLAAALGFYLQPDRPAAVRVLDDPLNRHHGRAAQLHIWGLDESALAAQPPMPGWLLVEEPARRFSDRWHWYQDLCARFAGLRLDGVLNLHDGRKRFVRWRHDGYAPQGECRDPAALPPLGWVDDSQVQWQQGEPLLISGWVVQAGQGIESVELLVDGESLATVPRTQPAAWATQTWGELDDPAGEQLGFRFVVDTSDWQPGRYPYRVLARRPDGRVWPIHAGHIELVR